MRRLFEDSDAKRSSTQQAGSLASTRAQQSRVSPRVSGIITIRNRLSDFLAAYLPFERFCNAVLPRLITVHGLIPASREAWVRETLSFRIFEITESTRSQVSLNFSGLAKYWASVRGAVCLTFDRALRDTFLVPAGSLRPGLVVAGDICLSCLCRALMLSKVHYCMDLNKIREELIRYGPKQPRSGFGP
jgi:hypothetical protein